MLILQHFRHFTNVTAHSPTVPLLHQRYSSFSNTSFASRTSQALHLRHLASHPCYECFSILLCARTRKVFRTLPIPAVTFKETTNSPSPFYSLQIFSREYSLNSPKRLYGYGYCFVNYSLFHFITNLFSLVSAFSQKNRTYKMGLGVCVCLFVCVSVYSFGPP